MKAEEVESAYYLTTKKMSHLGEGVQWHISTQKEEWNLPSWQVAKMSSIKS